MKSQIRQLLKLPPHIILLKISNRLYRNWKNIVVKNRLTKIDFRTSLISSEDLRFGEVLAFKIINVVSKTPLAIAHDYQLNLLGSGIIRGNYNELDMHGGKLDKIVNFTHKKFSQSLWNQIVAINPDYQPIDWQKDFKSGFRFSAKQWFGAQRKLIGSRKGVDLKVPWELSRLQHHPTLLLLHDSDSPKHTSNVKQVVCEILDFIMANPIGMGVNFNCPMDIGIRNANLLLSVDIIKSRPTNNIWTDEIEQIVLHYVAQSTIHILTDIEYRTGLTSNHYLGNVLGILFAGFYIDNHKDSDRWLAFGLQELERSMERQFFDDGANFEGSTSYHRLSGEMMIWGAWLALQISDERKARLKVYKHKPWGYEAPLFPAAKQNFNSEPFLLSAEFWRKLLQGGIFTQTIAKPNGEIPQFGDNDSGRFISISPVGEALPKKEYVGKYKQLKDVNVEEYPDMVWDENHLNHAGYVSAVMGLFNMPVENGNLLVSYEYTLFNNLSKQTPEYLEYVKQFTPNKYKTERHTDFTPLEYHKQQIFKYDVNLLQNISSHYCPDFQIAVFKSDSLYLSVAGTSNMKQHHSWGHTHNDKLSFELQVNGEDIFVNPGTYLYTPEPEMRYLFRSVKSHNTISVNGQEQNTPLPGAFGLFNMKRETSFRLLQLSDTHFVGELKYRDIVHIRKFQITENEIILDDWCNFEFEQHFNDKSKLYSNGYGQLIAG